MRNNSIAAVLLAFFLHGVFLLLLGRVIASAVTVPAPEDATLTVNIEFTSNEISTEMEGGEVSEVQEVSEVLEVLEVLEVQEVAEVAEVSEILEVVEVVENEFEENFQLSTFNSQLIADEPPAALNQIRPVYPAVSRRRGEQGTVTHEITISEKGVVIAVELLQSSGFSELDRAARQALLAARFTPATQNGASVQFRLVLPIEFDLR